MALTSDSIRYAVRRKAKRAQDNVHAAEEELHAANVELRKALPRHDEQAIAHAAQRTLFAEEEVRLAAQELEAVSELLNDGTPIEYTSGNASGEGAHSLLPWLRRRG
jgi:hypothetical protein